SSTIGHRLEPLLLPPPKLGNLVEVYETGVGLPRHPSRRVVVEEQPAVQGYPSGQPQRGAVEHDEVYVGRERYVPWRRRILGPPGGYVEIGVGSGAAGCPGTED